MIHSWVKGIVLPSLSAGLQGWGWLPERARGRSSDRLVPQGDRRDQGRSCVRGVGRAAVAGRSVDLAQISGFTLGAIPQVIARRLLRALAGSGVLALTATSAILVKEAQYGNVTPAPLASVAKVDFAEMAHIPVVKGDVELRPLVIVDPLNEPRKVEVSAPVAEAKKADLPELWPKGTRFFNGRPIRPVKTMKMVVTAYSPDARSCGTSADGITATLHSVHTNGHRLVAADPRVLAYGSMLTVPGYDSGNVVPVLDCGGAIKGNRLDLLFPTHEQARKWGRKTVTVTVWGYADGKPAPNPRKAREGKAK